jgi:hypothetical protein
LAADRGDLTRALTLATEARRILTAAVDPGHPARTAAEASVAALTGVPADVAADVAAGA